jgi:hypothetical protein
MKISGDQPRPSSEALNSRIRESSRGPYSVNSRDRGRKAVSRERRTEEFLRSPGRATGKGRSRIRKGAVTAINSLLLPLLLAWNRT